MVCLHIHTVCISAHKHADNHEDNQLTGTSCFACRGWHGLDDAHSEEEVHSSDEDDNSSTSSKEHLELSEEDRQVAIVNTHTHILMWLLLTGDGHTICNTGSGGRARTTHTQIHSGGGGLVNKVAVGLFRCVCSGRSFGHAVRRE